MTNNQPKKKKPDNVRITQIVVHEKTSYRSNGTEWKYKVKYENIYGLGDDGMVYMYGEHDGDDWMKDPKWFGWELIIDNKYL